MEKTVKLREKHQEAINEFQKQLNEAKGQLADAELQKDVIKANIGNIGNQFQQLLSKLPEIYDIPVESANDARIDPVNSTIIYSVPDEPLEMEVVENKSQET